MSANAMLIWTIYEKPKDHPDHYVVRRFMVSAGIVMHDPVCQLADTLENARALLPAGLVNLGRSPQDQNSIIETWL